MRRKRKQNLAPISLGTVIRENLPIPYVHYPDHYGVFFAFSRTEHSSNFLCSCTEQAVKNYVDLMKIGSEKIQYAGDERNAPLNSRFFPKKLVKNSLERLKYSLADEIDPFTFLEFKKGLCHRCNLTTPSLRYCHEMYGGQFIQSYGWYVKQAYVRLGIDPDWFYYLPEVCPKEFQEDLAAIKSIKIKSEKETNRIMKIVQGPPRDDIPPGEKTYWKNVRFSEAEKMKRLHKESHRITRAFTKKIENIARQEFGFKKIGEGWVSETLLYNIIVKIFENHKVMFHYRPEWLKGLEIDIFVQELNLAIEYQGQQHFYPVEHWGGAAALKIQQERDVQKVNICREKKVKLVTIDYTEALTESNVRRILKK